MDFKTMGGQMKTDTLLKIYKVVKVKLNPSIHQFVNTTTYIYSDERLNFIW